MRSVLLGMLVVACIASHAWGRGEPSCQGQYVLDTGVARPGIGPDAPDVVELNGRTISIRGLCEATTARFGRRRGKLRVRASWRACGTGLARVRMQATIDTATCKTMDGSFVAKSPTVKTPFSATRAVRLLVFTRTEGFRHPSIDAAVQTLGTVPAAERIAVTHTEDAALFTDDSLAAFDVVAFVNTTGDVLDDPEQAALERFVRAGNGFVGVHSAADTEYDWPWYGRLVGAYFTSHPLLPVEVTTTTEDPNHPSTAHLPSTFQFTDEIYNFDRNPRADNAILLTIVVAGFIYPNYPPTPSMGADHPVAWYKEFEGGRSFYTNLGHRPESWDDERFRRHLLAGIHWAAAPVAYNRIVLTGQARNPMSLAVASDGRIFYVERTGEVWVWNPETGLALEAARLPVDTTAENGLLGIALDPAFATTGFVFLYHSEPIPNPRPATGPPGENVLSRFTARADGTLDPASRVDILRVPSERECCHEGGALAFAPDGTLFVSVGDNTNPFASEGTAPLDERPGQERFNSQRTAANPMDLRGKILRINPDGSIPAGNLFPGGDGGRPEIFTMGNRNPFRVAVDPLTGRLFWGEVGPDGFVDSARGPRGLDEINFADAPGNYGWPYCIGMNQPYADYDFATGTPGPPFSCDGLVPALLAYDYFTTTYLALGDGYGLDGGFVGRTAIAGAFYRVPPEAPFVLPAPFADGLLMTDWTRDIVAGVRVDAAGGLEQIRRFLPWERFLRPIDVEVGADGALYVLEYGSGYFGDNDDARLSRVEHSADGTLTPVAVLQASATTGSAPLVVTFTAEGSRAPGDVVKKWLWDVDGDGRPDARGPKLRKRFKKNGRYPVALTVVAASGRKSFPTAVEIVVGNQPPAVTIESPANGASVAEGSIVTLRGSAVDPEDGPASCDALVWDIRLGHNAHTHPVVTLGGCTAAFPANVPDSHDAFGGVFYAVELSYTDAGGPDGLPALTARTGIRLEIGPASP